MHWLIPQWPAPQSVRALCTTRHAGQSLAPYASFNLGEHVGDRLIDVQANRTALAQAIAAKPVFLSQVHGVAVRKLGQDSPDALVADACFTREHGVACTIMMADCLPVLLTDSDGSFVAAAHAGWRGLAGVGGESGLGVLESLLAQLRSQQHLAPILTGNDSAELMAWLGPCIGPQAFEVGPEVRSAFVSQQSQAEACFTPLGEAKWLADLAGLARLCLQALGVTEIYGNDSSTDWCTLSNPLRFFSHRRDRVSGRMAACIWLS